MSATTSPNSASPLRREAPEPILPFGVKRMMTDKTPIAAFGAAAASGFRRLVSIMNAVGTIGVLGLMVLINADIAGRAVLNAPITGVPEMVAYSIVGIVFLQLAHTLRSGALTRSDLLLDILARSAPMARRILVAIFNLIGALMLTIALIRFWPGVIKAYDDPSRHFLGNPGFFIIPYWPLYALIALGLATTAVQFVINAIASLAGRADDHSELKAEGPTP